MTAEHVATSRPQTALLSVSAASELLRSRQLSPLDLTRACLDRIDALNVKLNAFITVMGESALAEARAAETEIANGRWRGPLHGIPISLKDLVDTAGVRTTAASELFKDRIPDADAELVRRLKTAGAILIGKTNLHEFAYGGSALVSYFGVMRNPWDPARITGGSSGGAAAAVATGMCYAAIGTDTAGSIRLPSALCGVVGLKPTYGRVSTRGVIPLAWSYDHAGPITRTVEDAALVLRTIAGYDELDPASAPLAEVDYAAALQQSVAALRVGVPRQHFFADLDPEIAVAVEQALTLLDKLTAGRREIHIPVEPDYTVHTTEAYTYHAPFIADAPEKYQPETLRRIRSAEKTTAAEYIHKRRDLDRMRNGAANLFRDLDVIVTPTVPALPPLIADLEREPRELRRKETVMLRNTRPFNIYGLPAITVPCGFSASGLPIGLQIAGRQGDDALVMALAQRYEQTVFPEGIPAPRM